MGYFVNDILAVEVNLLFGPTTDGLSLLQVLSKVALGNTQHCMVSRFSFFFCY
jgi:hypothetical protein